MQELWMRITENLSNRVSGPMHLRFILQPVMATLLAIRSGLKDAKAGKPPYTWSLIFHPHEPSRRREMIKDGWQSISKLCFAALALDLIYQFIRPAQLLSSPRHHCRFPASDRALLGAARGDYAPRVEVNDPTT
jgi:hypothetical protein